jgi:DNA adenine methylase
VTPFLKWAGGKKRLAATVVAHAPTRFGRYHEPFLGGGAVFFALRSAGYSGPATLADASAELISCFEAVRDEIEPLIARLRRLADDYLLAVDRAEVYYAVRSQPALTPVDRAARMLFLNRTCYNGLYRVNRRGEFNVPHGRYLNPRIIDEVNLRACSTALQGVELRCEDFEAACDRASRSDFVYLDPPYQPLSRTSSFTGYTAGAFGKAEQERLRDCFERMTARGVAAVLSNSEHSCTRDLYDDHGYVLEEVAMSRAINSVPSKRTAIAELLVSNTSRPEVRAVFERQG